MAAPTEGITTIMPADKPSEADELRKLLSAIHDALEIPRTGSPEAHDRLVADRALTIQVATSSKVLALNPGETARWLREHVAKCSSFPEGGA